MRIASDESGSVADTIARNGFDTRRQTDDAEVGPPFPSARVNADIHRRGDSNNVPNHFRPVGSSLASAPFPHRFT